MKFKQGDKVISRFFDLRAQTYEICSFESNTHATFCVCSKDGGPSSLIWVKDLISIENLTDFEKIYYNVD